MNKRRARADALGRIAALVSANVIPDGDLLEGLTEGTADYDKVVAAIDEVVDELRRRAEKLRTAEGRRA